MYLVLKALSVALIAQVVVPASHNRCKLTSETLQLNDIPCQFVQRSGLIGHSLTTPPQFFYSQNARRRRIPLGGHAPLAVTGSPRCGDFGCKKIDNHQA